MMDNGLYSTRILGLVLLAIAILLFPMIMLARADTLDRVLKDRVLRCGVVLDFPPIGYRDEKGQPVGFDVEYCRDLALALKVRLQLVPMVWADRLPSIENDKADVVFASTSDTLERAKRVGFTIPYVVYYFQAVVHRDSGIKKFEDLRGKKVAIASGTLTEKLFLKQARDWGTEHLYFPQKNEDRVFISVSENLVHAGITSNTAVRPITEKYEQVVPGPRMPWVADYCSAIGPRSDVSWLNYLNLFITHQVRSGRYRQLWGKFIGGEPPDLRIRGVNY